MHFEHKAGDKVFIDYAGKSLYITDPETGEHIPVQVFLGVLGCSQYTYMEATLTQKKEDFTESCRRMLEYYEGVPRAVVPDNLKSAVQKEANIPRYSTRPLNPLTKYWQRQAKSKIQLSRLFLYWFSSPISNHLMMSISEYPDWLPIFL